jgi:ferredoxin
MKPCFIVGGVRRYLSLMGGGDDKSAEALTWLAQSGVKPNVASEVISVFQKAGGGTVSSATLKQLGDKGLQALIQSVERDLAAQERRREQQGGEENAKKISIFINNPRVSSTMKSIDVYPDEPLYDSASSAPVASLAEDLEFACGGNAACSTCHIVLDPAFFPLLPPAEEDEQDMLDLAWGPTDTSRLACQVKVPRACHGMVVTIPSESNNLF